MEKLKSKSVSESSDAKVLVIFGGNVNRRHEIISLLSPINDLSIYATLSLEEGIAKMKELNEVDIVLIGGRYSASERKKIKEVVDKDFENAKVTEPGIEYPYSNENIFSRVSGLVNI